MQREHLSKQIKRDLSLLAVTLLGRAVEEELASSEKLKITNAKLLPLLLPAFSLCHIYSVGYMTGSS